jgi:Cu/Ag efflux protein CusF
MPEMSMVFQVDNPAQLQDFSVNEKIEFIAEIRDKKYFAKELRKSN